VCRDLAVARHALDRLVVESDVPSGLFGIERQLIAEFLGATTFKQPPEFPITRRVMNRGRFVLVNHGRWQSRTVRMKANTTVR
jgi:hypothetical protein